MRIQAIQDEKDRIEREKREKEEAIKAQAEEEERARKAAEEEENAKKKKKKKSSIKRGSSFVGKPKVARKSSVVSDNDGDAIDVMETPDASRPGTASAADNGNINEETNDILENETIDTVVVNEITATNEENVAISTPVVSTNTGDDDDDGVNELEAAFESDMSFGDALIGGSRGGIFSNSKKG